MKRKSRSNYRKKSKTRAKKRYYKKRNAPLAYRQHYFKHKCVGCFPVTAEDGYGEVDHNFVFARYDYAGLVSNVIGVNSAPRFGQVAKNYEEYKVDGFKLKYIPSNITTTTDPSNPAATVGQIVKVWTWEDPDTYNTAGYTNEQIVTQESFKAFAVDKPVKLYRNNAPLARQMKAAWVDIPGTFTTTNGLPQASMALKVTTRALGVPTAPVTVGWIKYTYYVTFRGQARVQ